MKFSVISLNVSDERGTVKRPVGKIVLEEGHGIVGDAHAGEHARQISLLAVEDIDRMREKLPSLEPGDFAENITTEGIDLPSLPVGSRFIIGEVEFEVTQIGKKCHRGCEIMEKVGECVMPERGIFAKVIRGGVITDEDTGSYDI
jgi:cyclic pyranopterin phosphate synthase